MQDPPRLTPAHEELECALRSLPAPPTNVDPVAAAFAAGRRSTRPTLRLFQSTTAVLLLTTLAAPLLHPPQRTTPTPRQGEGSYATEAPPRTPPAHEISPQTLCALDRVVRTQGLDALPRSTPPTVTPTRLKNQSL